MPGSRDDDAPRWELPVWDPSGKVPRWEPERDTARAQAHRGVVPRTRVGVGVRGVAAPSPRRVAAAPTARPVPPKRGSSLAAPFVWWAAHPWIVLWAFVFLAPGSTLLLRALDDSGLDIPVPPVVGGLTALLAVALALAMVASARRSATRLMLGTVSALAVLGVLLWSLTNVTLGRTACPTRAGTDLGRQVATAALAAWQAGESGDTAWRGGQVDPAWRERTRTTALTDFQLTDSGCWERVAPLDGTRTWHEYRVTVQEDGRAALSKVVVVHTAANARDWKITGIEGPLP